MKTESKNRSIGILLQLMFDHKIDNDLKHGLCYGAVSLETRQIITEEERIILKKYIQNNRPSKFSSIKAFINRDSPFFWPSPNIKPRINWLKKHIKLNS